jgi:phenylalanyl-tRNA synthetase beta chain
MRVPHEWLSQYCAPELDLAGIEERLTMTGTKVEAVHHHGVGAVERFVVGRVLAVAAHPQADRLRICEVDVGAARPAGPASIVCGASNVAAGQSVAVALPGAIMPDGTRLEAAELRGVPSEGMILAEDELAIGPEHEGILVLDDLFADLPAPGTTLSGVLPIATDVLELEVTPNRPDCLSVYGVARELHAATGAPLASAPWREDPGSAGPLEGAEVSVECPELCPRFTARLLAGVSVTPSPPWLKARLSAAGQRPINNVVDITNYVMLLTGQPLHAFDMDLLAGARLTVRRARHDERVVTLDGEERVLDEQMVVIEDEQGPTSIAGVMGGRRSEVGLQTSRVLLEVASWSGPNIHRTSSVLGLRSEASARFEKGLAPEQCQYAQALASRLMVELCGARLSRGTLDIGAAPPTPARIALRSARVEAILGVPVPVERQTAILRALDFATAELPGGLEVTVPALRREDVTREADLIEEVARIDGLEKLPATLPSHRPAGRLSREQRLHRRASEALVGRGLNETVGWTFNSAASIGRLRLASEDPRVAGAVALENPLSADHALLRTTLLCSLLDSAARNVARGMPDVGLFEVGTVFTLAASHDRVATPTPGQAGAPARGGTDADVSHQTGVHEHKALGVLLSGHVQPATWRAPRPPCADLYAIKGLLEAIAKALHVKVRCEPDPGRHPFLHPGRAAEVFAANEPIGWLGELHPLLSGWDLQGVAAMELDLDRLIASVPGALEYQDLISYPALRQDLAVVLPEQVSADETIAAVREAAGALLDGARVFDVYTGPQAGEGKRSLALALSFRATDRTLSEADMTPVRERIVAALTSLGGELRG